MIQSFFKCNSNFEYRIPTFEKINSQILNTKVHVANCMAGSQQPAALSQKPVAAAISQNLG